MKAVLAALLSIIAILVLPKAANAADFEVLNKSNLFQTTAGKSISEIVTVRNLTSVSQTINLSWSGYDLAASEAVDKSVLAKQSIDFATLAEKRVSIAPLGTASINLTFKVPQNISSGDYYGRALVTNRNSQEIAHFTIRILGQLTEQLEIMETFENGENFTLIVANKGNRTSKLSLSAKIKRFLGKEIINLEAQDEVKSGQIKEINLPHKQLNPGYYNIEIDGLYGENDENFVTQTSFWIRAEVYIFALVPLLVILTLSMFVGGRKRA